MDSLLSNKYYSVCNIKSKIPTRALAGVAQWIECQTVNQRATSSIPSQGTCVGCGPGPQLGAV